MYSWYFVLFGIAPGPAWKCYPLFIGWTLPLTASKQNISFCSLHTILPVSEATYLQMIVPSTIDASAKTAMAHTLVFCFADLPSKNSTKMAFCHPEIPSSLLEWISLFLQVTSIFPSNGTPMSALTSGNILLIVAFLFLPPLPVALQ